MFQLLLELNQITKTEMCYLRVNFFSEDQVSKEEIGDLGLFLYTHINIKISMIFSITVSRNENFGQLLELIKEE
jgi:hypothetical protein